MLTVCPASPPDSRTPASSGLTPHSQGLFPRPDQGFCSVPLKPLNYNVTPASLQHYCFFLILSKLLGWGEPRLFLSCPEPLACPDA